MGVDGRLRWRRAAGGDFTATGAAAQPQERNVSESSARPNEKTNSISFD